MGDLQADVGAMKGRRPLRLGHLMEVTTDQRNHLEEEKERGVEKRRNEWERQRQGAEVR